MPNFYLIYKHPRFDHLTVENFVKENRQTAIDNSNKLNSITAVTTVSLAEKLFAAEYMTQNIRKTEKLLQSGAHESIKEEYQSLLHDMIQHYDTLSAHDFLAKYNFHVINVD